METEEIDDNVDAVESVDSLENDENSEARMVGSVKLTFASFRECCGTLPVLFGCNLYLLYLWGRNEMRATRGSYLKITFNSRQRLPKVW